MTPPSSAVVRTAWRRACYEAENQCSRELAESGLKEAPVHLFLSTLSQQMPGLHRPEGVVGCAGESI